MWVGRFFGIRGTAQRGGTSTPTSVAAAIAAYQQSIGVFAASQRPGSPLTKGECRCCVLLRWTPMHAHRTLACGAPVAGLSLAPYLFMFGSLFLCVGASMFPISPSPAPPPPGPGPPRAPPRGGRCNFGRSENGARPLALALAHQAWKRSGTAASPMLCCDACSCRLPFWSAQDACPRPRRA